MLNALIFISMFMPQTAWAQQNPVVYNASTSEEIVRAYAARYAIDADDFVDTLQCESGLRADAKGDHRKGVPTSYGVAQIHLPAHPDISKDQALDPFWALDWSARQFKANKQRMWSCWKLRHSGKVD